MSIVRDNLMNEPGYTPYCGDAGDCSFGMPRTRFDGGQFVCRCGWRSGFEASFIEQYKQRQAALSTAKESPLNDPDKQRPGSM